MNTPVPTSTGKVYTGARLVLGLVFFVFGLNGFFGFFHAFLEPSTVAMPVVLTALHLGLAWRWRQAYAPLLPQVSSAPRVVVATTAARAV